MAEARGGRRAPPKYKSGVGVGLAVAARREERGEDGDAMRALGDRCHDGGEARGGRRRRRLVDGGEAGGTCRRRRREPERQEAGTGATATARQDQAPSSPGARGRRRRWELEGQELAGVLEPNVRWRVRHDGVGGQLLRQPRAEVGAVTILLDGEFFDELDLFSPASLSVLHHIAQRVIRAGYTKELLHTFTNAPCDVFDRFDLSQIMQFKNLLSPWLI